MEQRPQAGPLPVKTPRLVGEIGYSEMDARVQEDGVGDDEDAESTEGLNAAEVDARNGRHPADRSQVPLTIPSTTSLPNATTSTGEPSSNISTASLDTMSKHSIFSLRSLSTRLSSRKFAGVTLKTLIRFFLLVFSICGLVVAWVFAARHLVDSTSPPSQTPSPTSGTSAIFIHVAFTVLVLLLVIFVERTVFQMRAERYAHLHPGETLPSHRHHTHSSHGRSNGMGYAPWNRPPLPTYAAALGVRGTGDVEDAIIAAPPPPAYGNTRGSTLILAGFLRNSRGSHRSRASGQEGDASLPVVGGSHQRTSGTSIRGSPVSYDEAELHSDVERARILEAALAKLEDNAGRRR